MLKFHQQLLIILCTITIVSFLVLGFIVTHVIYSTVSYNQQQNLNNRASHFINLLNHGQRKELTKQIKNEQITVKIKQKNKEIYTESSSVPISTKFSDVTNTAPLNYDKYNKKHRYTYETTVDNYKVIISGVNNHIHTLQLKIWYYFLLSVIVVILVMFLVVRMINRTYIRPIKEVTYATQLLAEGYYHVRVPESNVKETKELFVTTNELARKLQRLNNQQKLQSNRLKTTLENIPSSILMIDKYGEIVIANRTYYEVFAPDKSVEHHSYIEMLDDKVQNLITDAFKMEKALYHQVKLNVSQVHEKYFDTACVPILSKSKKHLYGMVIVLHDITNLKKLENLRREFVANVSHELKTPITSIKGFAETLIDGAKDDPQSLNAFLDIILKESERIESLVFDLLDLSHVEQQSEIATTRLNLAHIVQSNIDSLQTIAEKKSININANLDSDVYIEANEGKISQVVINLVSNAINYSPKNSEIIIRVYEEQHKSILVVEDFGIGISEQDQQHIFERFYRVDKARSRDSGGTGLGLSIAKHIVEAHKGRISVSSKPNQGSIFKVIFFDDTL
ncbi:two-component system histidine kinase PnpS [Staphylococcus durrellii]|uniref:two-component system histidine kinase PnpS n=1 Tax=Staphylococcus durrellii TaxID=2781773 RepID=UPI00189F6A7E|nr:ATP-binding protein [Staphylococcus durrellii]MBF7016882.1 PAS domain-containing sensor histidine kinase [Staphylococcus durrellii]